MTMNDFTTENDLPEDSGELVYALAGTGQRLFAARASGLERSEDGGRTWKDALADQPLSEPMPVLALAVSPRYTEDGVVLAGVPGGVFRSADGGQTWQAVLLPAPPPTVSALAGAVTANGEVLFLAGSMEDGVFISQDAGQSWVTWNFGLLDLNVMCLAVSPAFDQDETIFAGTESGLFRSTNGGRAWRDLELPFGFEAVLSLALSPRYGEDHTLYLGTESQGLWVSTDEGESWQPRGAFEDPVNGLQVGSDPAHLLAVTSGGLWRSLDGGQNWADCLGSQLDELGQDLSALLPAARFEPGRQILAGFVGGEVKPLVLL